MCSDARHSSQNVNFHLLNALMHGQALVDVHIGKVAVVGADDPVGLTLEQQFHGEIAHLGGIDPVTTRGGSATLDVTQNGDPGIQVDGILDLGGNINGSAGSLRHHDHIVGKTTI